jgi:hypothetical protein
LHLLCFFQPSLLSPLLLFYHFSFGQDFLIYYLFRHLIRCRHCYQNRNHSQIFFYLFSSFFF